MHQLLLLCCHLTWSRCITQVHDAASHMSRMSLHVILSHNHVSACDRAYDVVCLDFRTQLFYILFLPFLFWCVDVPLARRLSCLWGVVYFVGQSAKDLLRLPRPPSPPVTKLEVRAKYKQAPASHACSATTPCAALRCSPRPTGFRHCPAGPPYS